MMKLKKRRVDIETPIQGIRILMDGLFGDAQIILDAEDQSVLRFCSNFIAWTETLHEKSAEAVLEALIERLGSENFLGVDDPSLAHEASQLNSELVAEFSLHREALMLYQGEGVGISHIHAILSQTENLETIALLQIDLCRLEKNMLPELLLEDADLDFIPKRMFGLLAILEKNTSLESLIFNKFLLNAEDLKALAEFLGSNAILKTLTLSNGCLNGQDISPILTALAKNTTLTTLDLTGNSLGDDAGVAIAAALKSQCTLESLSLCGNLLSDVTGREMAEALKTNKTLKNLDLSYNHLTDDSGELLASAVRCNDTLSVLMLDGLEGIGDKSLKTLFSPLDPSAHFSLTRLYLLGVSLTHEGAIAVSNFLATNNALVYLAFSWVAEEAGASVTAALAPALEVNTSLKTLDLRHNEFGDADISLLLNALKVNHTLKILYLMFENWSKNATMSLHHAWIEGLALKRLFFVLASELDPEKKKIYQELFEIIVSSRLLLEQQGMILGQHNAPAMLASYSGFKQALERLDAFLIEEAAQEALLVEDEAAEGLEMEAGSPEALEMEAGSPEDFDMEAGSPEDWEEEAGAAEDWEMEAGSPEDWEEEAGAAEDWEVEAGSPEDLPISETRVPKSLGAFAMRQLFEQNRQEQSSTEAKMIGFSS